MTSPSPRPRRLALARRLAIVLPLVALIVVLLARVDFAPNLSHLHIGLLTGSPQGNYAAIGRTLAERAHRRGGVVDVLPTEGAVDNLARLSAARESCEVQFGLAQSGLPLPEDHGLHLLGRLRKAESMFLLGRDADRIRNFEDLRGLRIGIGPEGSGTAALARLVLEARDFNRLELALSHHDTGAQLDRLQSGELDLGVFVIDEDAALIDDAVRERGLQIASFDHLDVVARRHAFLWDGRIGAGQFDPVRVLPPTDKRVLRVDTIVVGNGCASHAQTVAFLGLLADVFPDFVRHNQETPNGSGLELLPASQTFFTDGGASWADEWVPWLVDVAPPSNWVYIVMVVSVAFNVMGFSHRFRLWRIDVARVELERRMHELLGAGLTPAEIESVVPGERLRSPAGRRELDGVVEDLAALRDRCRRYSLSVLVPMGQEMGYRYQEETIHADLAAMRGLAHRLHGAEEATAAEPSAARKDHPDGAA